MVGIALTGQDLADVVQAVLRQNRSHRLAWALGQAAAELGQTDLRSSDGKDRWKWSGRGWIEVL